LATYLVCVIPVVGDLAGFILVPFLAPFLLTLAMINIVIASLGGRISIAALILPLGFYGYGVSQMLEAKGAADAARAQVAAFNSEFGGKLAGSPPRRLIIVNGERSTGIQPQSLFTQYNVSEVTVINKERGSALRYSILPATGKMRELNDSERKIFHTWIKDAAGNEAYLRHAPTEIPEDDLHGKPYVEVIGTMDVDGIEGAKLDVYEIRRGTERLRFLSGGTRIPDGIMFPLVMRGPVGGGGTSMLDYRLMGDVYTSFDADHLSEEDRLAGMLGLEKQDLSRLRR
jgi:hypothetical protein